MKKIISGIYKIENKTNGHIYIGSAVDISHRWRFHRSHLNNNKHHSGHLQNAWNKYGKHNFDFVIIEECKKSVLIKREQFYIDTLDPEYNIARVAGNCLGVKHTEETKRKVSLAGKGRVFSDEHRKNLSIAMKKYVKTEEHSANISKGKTGKKASNETKRKMAERMKGNSYALGNTFTLTDEQKRKTSEGLRKSYAIGNRTPYKGKKKEESDE